MKRRTITLPEQLDAQLEEEGRRRRVPVSQLVREALESRFDEQPEGDRYQFIGMFNQPGYPDSDHVEEFLNRHWMNDILTRWGR